MSSISLHSRLVSVNEKIFQEECRLHENFLKLEFELNVSKQLISLLQRRVIDLERQCWDNV